MSRFAPALLATLALLSSSAAAVVGVNTGHNGVPLIHSDQVLECPNEAGEGRFLKSWPSTGHKLEKGTCSGGLAVGGWTAWHENGVKSWTGWLESGRFEGKFRSWYDNGQKRSRLEYLNGLLDGASTLWWEDGTVRGTGDYEQGQEQGCHRGWHRDGGRAAVGAYLDGEKVGRWFYWNEQGTRRKELYGGSPSSGRCWWPLF
jgi:hypothetical protein